MPLEDLIPIGGASRGLTNSITGDTKGLTSGLIAIAGARDKDVDMSDFDLGDLLDDDLGKSKSKLSLQSHRNDKNNTSTKEKLKSFSRSKKKSKSKSKLRSHNDNNDMSGNWSSLSKKWDSAAEIELAAARRKNGGGKIGRGLDDELARVLGGNAGGGADFGSVNLLQDDEKIDKVDTDGLEVSEHAFIVEERHESDTHESSNERKKTASSRCNNDTSNDDVIALLPSSTTERRGRSRGGRRQASGGASDPFSGTTSITTFDTPFGISAKSRAFDDLFTKPARDFPDSLDLSERQNPSKETKSHTRQHTLPSRDTAPIERVSAKDDFLAHLFASDKAVDENTDKRESPVVAASKVAALRADCLTELIIPSSCAKSTENELEQEAIGKLTIPSTQKSLLPFKQIESSTTVAQPFINAAIDLASAKDSLLLDLLGDLSTLQPSDSLPLRGHSISICQTNTNSPAKEIDEPLKTLVSSSPLLPQLSLIVDKVSLAPVLPIAPLMNANSIRPLSPECRVSSSVDLEGGLEQSNDKLLANVRPLAPSVVARSSLDRRNSLAHGEDGTVAEGTKEKITAQPRAKVQAQILPAQSLKPGLPESYTSKGQVIAAVDTERELQLQIENLEKQMEAQGATSMLLTRQLEESLQQLSQQLEAQIAANAELTQALALAERDRLQADHVAAKCNEKAASSQHRAELLEAELSTRRDELLHSKRACQDVELTLARLKAEQEDGNQLERHREKRALEALSAQMQRALARLSISHQVQEEEFYGDHSAARVAAEDEARLRVIASLEGSSKRAAQHAEQERVKLTELLRQLEAGARHARQGALEDKERLRQEQQRLDALSAHLQAHATALRDQEAAHAGYMGKQFADVREDICVQEARLATRRTQLERDERAVYQVRAEFAAFREQRALEMERERDEVRFSQLEIEDARRALRADRDDLMTALASHEGEFQALDCKRQALQVAEAHLSERTQAVVTLAETLDTGTRELVQREHLLAQQAAVVQDMDASFSAREQALACVKYELQAREQRVHVQIRQLDTARERLMKQRQQLLVVSRRKDLGHIAHKVVDGKILGRQSDRGLMNTSRHLCSVRVKGENQLGSAEPHFEGDPSGLSPALRKQVEANWRRRNME